MHGAESGTSQIAKRPSGLDPVFAWNFLSTSRSRRATCLAGPGLWSVSLGTLRWAKR